MTQILILLFSWTVDTKIDRHVLVEFGGINVDVDFPGLTFSDASHTILYMEQPRLKLPRETQRLILCPPDPAHARQVQDAIEETFDDLHRWMRWARQLQPFHETKAFLERAKERFDAGEDFGVLAFLRGNGSFVLGSGLYPRNWEVPSFEIMTCCPLIRLVI
jgi:hypothetical protein